MILIFGEILYDLFPGGKRLGGAPFNFAYHLRNLGFDVRFISRVAGDKYGKEILEFLKKNSFNVDDIQIDEKCKTGTVEIELLENGEHSFNIVENAAYDNLELTDRIMDLIKTPPELIYFGTLIQRTSNGFKIINSILNSSNKKTKLFCDLNLRPACYNKEIIEHSLFFSDLLKINNDEFNEINNLLFENKLKDKADFLKKYNISNLIITKGDKGSLWFNKKNHINNYTVEKINVTDTVGAGDAFSAVSAAGYLQKLPLKKILRLSTEFASFICTINGALPETDFFYKYLKREMEIKNEK